MYGCIARVSLALLEPVPTITVVGVVDVGGALRRPSRRMVDVVLLDLLPPECLNILHRLRQLHRRVRVVAIASARSKSEVLACAAAGIDGYVPVNARPTISLPCPTASSAMSSSVRRKSRRPFIIA